MMNTVDINGRKPLGEQEEIVVYLKPRFKSIIFRCGELATDGEVLERCESMLEENGAVDTRAYKLLSEPRTTDEDGQVLDDFIDLLNAMPIRASEKT